MVMLSRREGAFGAIVIAIFVCLGATYVTNIHRTQKVLENERQFASIAAQSVRTKAMILDLRRREKDFLLTHDVARREDFDALATQLDRQFTDMKHSQMKAAADALETEVAGYRQESSRLFDLRESLGLNADVGLEGALRKSVHEVEGIFNALGRDDLLVQLLMIRRHEKDFMMRGQQAYLDLHSSRIATLRDLLQAADLEDEARTGLEDRLETYETTFAAWVGARRKMEVASRDVEARYSELIRQMDAFEIHAITLSDLSALAFAQSRRTSNILLLLMAGVTIGAAVMLITLMIRRQAYAAAIARIADEDCVTRLPNRRDFFRRLDALLADRRGSREAFAVAIVDLDGFKLVNDLHGQGAGDQVLRICASRLKALAGDDLIVARLGADQFGVIATIASGRDAMTEAGRRIRDAVSEPYRFNHVCARVGATLGMAVYPESGATAEKLVDRAGHALFHAKLNARGDVVIFEDSHEAAIREESAVTQALQEADLQTELSVMFQPIVDDRGGQVVGMEALARWNSPVLGRVNPDMFIKAAEQTGVISRLTPVLLTKALAAVRSWPDHVYLSFNLSVMDLATTESLAALIKVIRRSDIAPERLVFEITETAVMGNVENARKALERLKSIGAQVALDDFGTGYSSLGYIQNMPLDRLKVDRSFIECITTSKTTRDIMRSILGLCSNLELVCIVEGVEDQSQLEVLRDMGARFIQGYYFSRPLSREDALVFLTEGHADRLNDWISAA